MKRNCCYKILLNEVTPVFLIMYITLLLITNFPCIFGITRSLCADERYGEDTFKVVPDFG